MLIWRCFCKKNLRKRDTDLDKKEEVLKKREKKSSEDKKKFNQKAYCFKMG